MLAAAGIVVTEISTPMSAPDFAVDSDSIPAIPAQRATNTVNTSGLAMMRASSWSSWLKLAGASPVALKSAVAASAAAMASGKPTASARPERSASPARRWIAATQTPAIGPNSGPTTIAPTTSTELSSRIAAAASSVASTMKARKESDSSELSDVRASTSSHTTASAGAPRAASTATSPAREMCVSTSSSTIAPVVVDAQLAQVGDEHAGVLARHVGQDQVAVRAPRGPGQADDVAGRRAGGEQVGRSLRLRGRGDDAQVDHRSAPLIARPATLAGRARARFVAWPELVVLPANPPLSAAPALPPGGRVLSARSLRTHVPLRLRDLAPPLRANPLGGGPRRARRRRASRTGRPARRGRRQRRARRRASMPPIPIAWPCAWSRSRRPGTVAPRAHVCLCPVGGPAAAGRFRSARSPSGSPTGHAVRADHAARSTLCEEAGGDLLSQAREGQVPSALRGLTALFEMGRGVSLSLMPPKIRRDRPPSAGPQNRTAEPIRRHHKNPSSPRPISTGLLHTSPCFQIRPINLVIFQGSYSLKGMGELISRSASRLDAFSGYPIRT